MAEATFENAKVGDRVWSVNLGWGVVKAVHFDGDRFPLKVRFEQGGTCSFTVDGRWSTSDIGQTLFWSEVNITAPERPKRKVQKTVEAWANIYENRAPYFHYTEKDANCLQSSVDKRLFCVKLVGSYEVEE